MIDSGIESEEATFKVQTSIPFLLSPDSMIVFCAARTVPVSYYSYIKALRRLHVLKCETFKYPVGSVRKCWNVKRKKENKKWTTLSVDQDWQYLSRRHRKHSKPQIYKLLYAQQKEEWRIVLRRGCWYSIILILSDGTQSGEMSHNAFIFWMVAGGSTRAQHLFFYSILEFFYHFLFFFYLFWNVFFLTRAQDPTCAKARTSTLQHIAPPCWPPQPNHAPRFASRPRNAARLSQ